MIGFGFASHWLKNWRASFKPITKLSSRNRVIIFDSHLKTTLTRKHLHSHLSTCIQTEASFFYPDEMTNENKKYMYIGAIAW